MVIANHSRADFEGKASETALLYQKNKLTPRILLVGLGKKNEETNELWRKAGGSAAAQLKNNMGTLTILPPNENSEFLNAFVEGLLMRHYRYQVFLNEDHRKLMPIEKIQIVVQRENIKTSLEKHLEETIKVVEAIYKVRDMVTAPSNIMSPEHLGREAKKIAKKSRHIKCTVWDEKKIQKMKMGCLMGVGKGAHEKPRFIIMEHKYKALNKKPIVLIGKGICFDAGGLNIKTRDLEHMKYDMTGAATVLGVFQLLSQIKLPLHVVGIAPCAENLLGEEVSKPGDILNAYDGTTVEIINTDAEGRLVLCDAIAYAVKKYEPEALVDIATLTGAAIVALGYDISAVLTNNDALCSKLKKAAQTVDEKVWQLPLDEDYKKTIQSDVADIKNYSLETSAGTIMGAAFLEYFVKKTPWVHIDMGGSAWTNTDKPYTPKGATGRNVKTLWQFLKDYMA